MVGKSEERTWSLVVGPGHPAGHGPIAFSMRVAGSGSDEVITWAEPLIYPLHRGAEKLFESRDYRQIMMLADRHDWLSAFGSELGLALTLESMLGITVPERADWIRTLMAELNRAIHHLRWLGETAGELGNGELRDDSRSAREVLTDFHESLSGGRVHPMLVQPGGVRADTPDGWASKLGSAITELAAHVAATVEWVDACDRLRGIAVVSAEQALTFATSGPVGRASGLALDLRLDDPYCRYPNLAAAGVLSRTTRQAGDAQARFAVLAEELRISLECVCHCAAQLDELGPGEVSVRIPRSLRVPEGHGYGWTENPTGINGWYLVSRGDTEPYRLKLRTASFANAQALSQVLAQSPVPDLPITLMSFLLVAGDLAK